MQRGIEKGQEQAALEAKRQEHMRNQLTKKSLDLVSALGDASQVIKQTALLMTNT